MSASNADIVRGDYAALEERARSATQRLKQYLVARGNHLHADKTIYTLAYRGAGPMRSVIGANTCMSPEVVRHACYLGPQMGVGDTTTVEVCNRVREPRRAWRRLDGVWQAALPWRAHRMLLIALVVNTHCAQV